MSDKRLLDINEALSRASNDVELLKAMAEVFYTFSEEQLIKLDNAVALNDTTEISDIAHRLRGSLGMLGSITAKQSAIILEEDAPNCDSKTLKQKVLTFKIDIEAFSNRLKIYIEKGL